MSTVKKAAKARKSMKMPKPAWAVYLLECRDGSLYCGVTTDLDRRVREHNSARAGAKYTRTRQPVKLRYAEPQPSRSKAQAREYALKRLARAEKLALIKRRAGRVSRSSNLHSGVVR